MLKTTDAGRAVRGPMFRLARSMRDAALLVGGGLARTPKLWRRLGDFSLLMAIAGSLVLAVNHTTGAAPKPWYYMSGGYGGGSQYDSDGDGVPDGQDRCPLVAGDAGCLGCPSALCNTAFPIDRSSSTASLGCDWSGYGGTYSTTSYFSYPSSGYGMPDDGTMAQGDVRISLRLAGGDGSYTSVWLYAPNGNFVGSYWGYPSCDQDYEVLSWTVDAQTFNAWRQTGAQYRLDSQTNNYWCWCTTNARLRFQFQGTMQPAAGSDADGDGYPVESDRCPLVAGNCFGCPDSDIPDTDGDGARDCVDNDDDNDGVYDWDDRCPLAFGSGSCLGCPESLCQGTQHVTRDLGSQYLDADWWGYGQQYFNSTRYYGLGSAPVAAGPATITVYANPGYDGWWDNSVIDVHAYDSFGNYYGYRQFGGGCWQEEASDWSINAATLNSLRSVGGNLRLEVGNRSAGCSPYIGMRLAYESPTQPQAGSDDDGDGYPIEVDLCPTQPGDCAGCPCDAPDADEDGVPDSEDNCPLTPNPSQADCDLDGTGDACESVGLTVKAWGAAGGANQCCYGGLGCGHSGIAGGFVRTDLTGVAPGTTLYIAVGQGGVFSGTSGTFGGGGPAGGSGGGSGGGASWVALVPNPATPSDLILVAGGGAGGTAELSNPSGNGGGLSGASSSNGCTGGSQSSGGIAGTGGWGGGGQPGSGGSFLQGGTGMTCKGNGGGGGLYGGGGGHGDCGDCSGSPGGGGSSFLNPAYCTTVYSNSQGVAQHVHPDGQSDPDWANESGSGENGDGRPGRVVLRVGDATYVYEYTGAVQTFVVPVGSANCEDSDGDGTPNSSDPDDDNDGVADDQDAFPLDPNESVDSDGDGIGNNSDTDDDNDGAADVVDGCPTDPNKSEPGLCGCFNAESVCGCGQPETDTDGDGVADCIDNCPSLSNPDQSDFDGDGIGNDCDADWSDCNANGIADASDLVSGFSSDCNGNRIPDECENGSAWRSTGDMGGVYTSPTPREATGQLTNLPIAQGDVVLTIRAVADLDANNESLTLFLADPKNPVAVLFGPNSPACGQLNTAELTFSAQEWNAIRDLPGGDSITVTLQPSFAVNATCDGNGTSPIEGYTEVIVEYLDAVPDCNNNGVWDECDPDTDGDGTIDDCDGCPNDPTKQNPGVCGCNAPDTDSDGDGAADCIDTDDDNDGVPDAEDAFPLDANESVDTDGDGVGNNADGDDDNDGVADPNDAFPLDASESADADGDGTGDNGDLDDDNDGTDDSVDGCPLDGSKQEPGQCGCGTPDTDTDNDGTADCLESPFGSVGGWGYNEYGQLNVPVGLPVAKQISSGYQHTLALLMDGSVAAWGFNQLGQCDVPAGLSGVLSIAGGRDHSLALKQDGSVVAWGSQVFGQSTVPAGLTNVARIAAGGDHSLALRHDGSIVAWGRNNHGQCDAPFDSAPFLDVAGGYSHSMAIRSDGTVVCWGDNSNGQCTVPAGLANVVAIAAGGSHSIALTSAGTVVCWGPDNPTTDVPAGLAGVTQIAAGTGHSVALKADGTVVCWGYNFENQCTVPADVQVCLQVAAGNSHTVVLQADCNHDAVADYLQLGGNDCNQDSILDACQLESGLIEDCNDNGLADQCEKAESIEFATGAIGPIGAGSAVTWTLPAAPLASTDVILSGSVRGDFDSPFESLTFKLDNVLTTVVVVNTGINTQCRETTFSLVIPTATFNAARQADGTVAARFEASVAVDPQACPGGTWIDVTATYITSTAADCNANGLIDSCELAAGLGTDQNGNGIPDDCENPATACPADLDRNGVVEGGDLAILLGAWGSGSAAQDITGDGLIDGSDVATMLGAWGSCVD